MISYRKSDLIDKIHPKTTNLYGWVFNREGKSYSIAYFKDDADEEIMNEIAKVLLGYDDFRRMELSKAHTSLGYGFRSQNMDNIGNVIFNLGQVINGIKAIPGVEKVEINKPNPNFVMTITHR